VNNNRIWRQFHFVPLTTSRVRVWVTRALGGLSRVVEIEAYAVWGAANAAPTVALTSPANNTAFPVSTPVALEATATDADGTVSQVDFYANGVLVGTDTTGMSAVFATTWTSAIAGTFSITAVATDSGGARRTSGAITITLTPPAGRVNVALATNGSTAVASSVLSGYPANDVINGERRGANWGNGGGWVDGTNVMWPDWVEVQFNGPQPIEEIDVLMVQDNYTAPSEPTLSMTSTKYALQDFVVEYWTGTGWAAVPGGNVVNNAKIWRQFNFAPITTSRIRVWVTRALGGRSRVVEIEAYTMIGG
jgi:Big-like domain-containing protein